MWKRRNEFYLENDGWTIAKITLKNGTKYALWQGNLNRGYFESSDEAKAKFEELNK